ncbi:TRAP transporter small permease [Rhodospirillum sp. A1_3_36]|uniref:TRAP transporter small permease n=1 Tax=Rhodospirillum sp. A1_3_36 TaxID=3391666 RepID=UPI0039A45A9C
MPHPTNQSRDLKRSPWDSQVREAKDAKAPLAKMVMDPFRMGKREDSMKRMTAVVDAVLGTLIVLDFVLLIACVFWQVFSRFAIGAPTTVTDELARFLFIWAALFGGAYTYGRGRHLAIDFLTGFLTGVRVKILHAAVVLAIAAFAVLVMMYGGQQLMMKTLASGQVSPVLRLPMGYVYGAIPLSGALIVFYCLGFLIDILGSKAPPKDGDTDAGTSPASPADTLAAKGERT